MRVVSVNCQQQISQKKILRATLEQLPPNWSPPTRESVRELTPPGTSAHSRQPVKLDSLLEWPTIRSGASGTSNDGALNGTLARHSGAVILEGRKSTLLSGPVSPVPQPERTTAIDPISFPAARDRFC